MKTWLMISASLVSLGLMSGVSQACPHTDLVQSWYQRYLGRPADCLGLQVWVGQLRGGAPAVSVQAQILASEEYFCRHGHSAEGFVTGLYVDVLGRRPCEHELRHWVCQLQRCGCRKILACDFLKSAGAVAHVPPPPPAYAPGGPPPVPGSRYAPSDYGTPPYPAPTSVGFRHPHRGWHR